jgi:hypothetical protein
VAVQGWKTLLGKNKKLANKIVNPNISEPIIQQQIK